MQLLGLVRSGIAGYWPSDLYEKLIYVTHVILSWTAPIPNAGPEYMPVSGLRPKEQLPKGYLDYALSLQVPYGSADEFELSSESLIEQKLTILPQSLDLQSFGPDENPVEFVMKQLSSIYPTVYQEWPDKLSDVALTRFCLHGLGAHRVAVETRDGQKLFVVIKTNALSGLPVRDGLERYGGDAYFDQHWKPVMIVDAGRGPLRSDGTIEVVTSRPGDADWERAKFRFRSTVFSLVTLVDHLYDMHLQQANLFVTAMREQMSEEHPIRRFMTPFTYRFGQAVAAAPSLLLNGTEVPANEGGPILFRDDYVEYLKKKGIDTEYWRQVSQLYKIYLRFVLGYLECYYPKKEDLTKDKDMHALVRQFFFQLETAPPNMLGATGDFTLSHYAKGVDDTYMFYAKFLAQIMFFATRGATATALLMSFTNLPQPKFL
ncbi:cel6A, partial [Symbiodinium pilosum]